MSKDEGFLSLAESLHSKAVLGKKELRIRKSSNQFMWRWTDVYNSTYCSPAITARNLMRLRGDWGTVPPKFEVEYLEK